MLWKASAPRCRHPPTPDSGRHPAVDGGAVAELADGVPTPGLDRSVRLGEEAVVAPPPVVAVFLLIMF